KSLRPRHYHKENPFHLNVQYQMVLMLGLLDAIKFSGTICTEYFKVYQIIFYACKSMMDKCYIFLVLHEIRYSYDLYKSTEIHWSYQYFSTVPSTEDEVTPEHFDDFSQS